MPSAPLPRRPARLRGLASALALAVGVAVAPPAARAAAPSREYEQRIAEADAHAEQGRHAEALAAYADAFATMPADLKASGVGEFVAVAAGQAAVEDYRARADRRSLEQGREVLLAFIDAARAADPSAEPAPLDGAEQRLAEIEALLPEPEPTPSADSGASTDTEDAAQKRRRLGLGLAVAGGVVALAGVGLFVAGARQVPWYEEQLASEGWLPTDPGYDDEIDAAERVRAIDMGLGAAALAVGVGLGITGAVLLAKNRRSRPSVAFVPVLGRDRALLGASVRF